MLVLNILDFIYRCSFLLQIPKNGTTEGTSRMGQKPSVDKFHMKSMAAFGQELGLVEEKKERDGEERRRGKGGKKKKKRQEEWHQWRWRRMGGGWRKKREKKREKDKYVFNKKNVTHLSVS